MGDDESSVATRARAENPRVTFETSAGTVTAEIYLQKMPLTASNFLDLVATGYYDGLHIHLVVPRVGVALGCPFAKSPHHPRAGEGAPPDGSSFLAPDGRRVYRANGCVRDEHPVCPRLSNLPGTLAMTNLGAPDSGGSQFFVNVAHNRCWDFFDRASPSAHPVFGRLDAPESLELVAAWAAAPATGDVPDEPIKILSAKMGTPEDHERAAKEAQEAQIRQSRRGSKFSY